MADWLFDRRGRPQLIYDGDCLLDIRGQVCAWLSGDDVYSRRGRHIGWFEKGVVYDSQNRALGFLAGAKGSTPGRPGLAGAPGMPGFAGRAQEDPVWPARPAVQELVAGLRMNSARTLILSACGTQMRIPSRYVTARLLRTPFRGMNRAHQRDAGSGPCDPGTEGAQGAGAARYQARR